MESSLATRLAALRAHLLTLLASVTLSGLLVWQRAAPPATALRVIPAPSPPPAATVASLRWQVHVTGAVASPGLVLLAPGARAADAVEAAGGLAAEAAADAINLAAPLADGLQIHVQAQGEPTPFSRAPAFAPPAAVGGGAATGPGADQSQPLPRDPGFPIDLNTAGAAELESLPGVGPALAARILAHRQANGPFQSVQDLLAVPGIGEKTLGRFEAQVMVR